MLKDFNRNDMNLAYARGLEHAAPQLAVVLQAARSVRDMMLANPDKAAVAIGLLRVLWSDFLAAIDENAGDPGLPPPSTLPPLPPPDKDRAFSEAAVLAYAEKAIEADRAKRDATGIDVQPLPVSK